MRRTPTWRIHIGWDGVGVGVEWTVGGGGGGGGGVRYV